MRRKATLRAIFIKFELDRKVQPPLEEAKVDQMDYTVPVKKKS
jgi:hypothetical protein